MDLVNAALDSLGLHFPRESKESSFQYKPNKVINDDESIFFSCLNVGGYIPYKPAQYIPVIGKIVGVARMVFAVYRLVVVVKKSKESIVEKQVGEDIYFAAFQIARGAFETFGPGYLLAIPDLIVTVGRLIHSEIKKRQEADSF